MSRAAGLRTPQEAQKAKALWKMKAAKDAGEEYYDPTRVDSITGRNQTRLAPQRPDRCTGRSPEVCGKFVLEVSARVLGGRVFRNGRCCFPPKFVGKADLGVRLTLLGSDELCVYAQHPWRGMCQGRTGRVASSSPS